MRRYMIVCLIIAAGLSVHAQTINLRGKVTNRGGKPIANAVVELVKQKLKDTTASDACGALRLRPYRYPGYGQPEPPSRPDASGLFRIQEL